MKWKLHILPTSRAAPLPPPLLHSSGFLHDCGTCHNSVLFFNICPFVKYQTEVAVSLLNTCRHCFAQPQHGVPSHDSCWGVMNNICPAFKISSHCRRKWEREEVGESIPEIHLNLCVQKAWRGRAALQRESLPPRHKWLLDTVVLRADGEIKL